MLNKSDNCDKSWIILFFLLQTSTFLCIKNEMIDGTEENSSQELLRFTTFANVLLINKTMHSLTDCWCVCSKLVMDQSSDSSCTVGISPALLQAIAQTLSTAANTGSSPASSLMASAGKPGLTTATASPSLTRPIIAVKVRTHGTCLYHNYITRT